MVYKVPLVLEPQPEGGYTVTSPLLPELLPRGIRSTKHWCTSRTL